MQAHRIVEAVLEAVADAILLAPETIEAGIADIQVPVEIAAIGRSQETRIERVEIPTLRVALVEAGDGQARLGTGLPGEGRRDSEALLFDIVVARVGETADGAEAVGELSVAIDRSLAGEAALDPAMAAGLDAQFVIGRGARHPADLVDQTAGADLTVQHGGRAFDDVDPVEQERIDRGHCEGLPARQLQAVEKADEIRRGAEAAESAQEDAVIARGCIPLGEDAGRVTQGIADRLRVLVVHLLPGHGRDRLRRLDHRRPGLRGGGRAAAKIFVPAVVPFSGHDQRVELHGRIAGARLAAGLRCGQGCDEAG